MKGLGKELGLAAKLADLTVLRLWLQGSGTCSDPLPELLSCERNGSKAQSGWSAIRNWDFFVLILSAELRNRIFLYFQLFFK